MFPSFSGARVGTDATRNDAICGGQGRPKKIIRDNKECVIRYIMTYDEVV